jgi:hypothetical protein
MKKEDLFALAQSRNPEDRKRAFKIYQAWVKAESTLPAQERLNFTQRHLLNQIFTQQKMKVDPRAS